MGSVESSEGGGCREASLPPWNVAGLPFRIATGFGATVQAAEALVREGLKRFDPPQGGETIRIIRVDGDLAPNSGRVTRAHVWNLEGAATRLGAAPPALFQRRAIATP